MGSMCSSLQKEAYIKRIRNFEFLAVNDVLLATVFRDGIFEPPIFLDKNHKSRLTVFIFDSSLLRKFVQKYSEGKENKDLKNASRNYRS